MKSFSQFITESTIKQIPWVKNPQVGWWEDQKVLRLYHGTNVRNLDAISKEGLTKADPDTGMISMALEPYTAFGYASMTFGGGRVDNFRDLGGRPAYANKEDRVVFAFDVPMEWIKQHYDTRLGGNIGDMNHKMHDKEYYSPGKDPEYYATAELRFKVPIPTKFLVGYMKKP